MNFALPGNFASNRSNFAFGKSDYSRKVTR